MSRNLLPVPRRSSLRKRSSKALGATPPPVKPPVTVRNVVYIQ
jgi:hypothetical protein